MNLDSSLFRQTLGEFMTGVAVCTSARGSVRRAMTANAITSVSLDPPLVLICVGARRSIHDLIRDAGCFAINILGEHQQAVAQYFAGAPPSPLIEEHNRLFGLPFHSAITGAPILSGCLAAIDCTLFATYPGGDHSIYVGKVEHLELATEPRDPLLYFRSRYCQMSAVELEQALPD